VVTAAGLRSLLVRPRISPVARLRKLLAGNCLRLSGRANQTLPGHVAWFVHACTWTSSGDVYDPASGLDTRPARRILKINQVKSGLRLLQRRPQSGRRRQEIEAWH